MTTVTVVSESFGEIATFCTSKDLKKHADYCPTDNSAVSPVEDADPLGWYVRVVFDELLDPDIETLSTDADGIPVGSIAGSGAFTVTCGGDTIGYDGFYQPSGSHLTYPPGPALVILPTDLAATSSDCSVTLGAAITDKENNGVPGDQTGPYTFTVAALSFIGSEPEDATEGVDPATVVVVQFNSLIDAQTLEGNITVNDGAADVEVALSVPEDGPNAVLIAPTAGAFAENTTFTVSINEGIADIAGGALPADGATAFSFTTGVAAEVDAGM